MTDKPPWFEETQTQLNDLLDSDSNAFYEWVWYCHESLNLDPNILPPIYLKNWLKLPEDRRIIGY